MLNLIADQAWNPFAPFGVTSWEPFVANLIAFILMVAILRYLAFKPIQNVLEKRRRRIEEGEEMREESERQLASVKEQTHEMLVEAGEKGQEKIDAAKAAAANRPRIRIPVYSPTGLSSPVAGLLGFLLELVG